MRVDPTRRLIVVREPNGITRRLHARTHRADQTTCAGRPNRRRTGISQETRRAAKSRRRGQGVPSQQVQTADRIERRTAVKTSCRHKRGCRTANIQKNNTRRPGRGTDWRTSAPVGKAKNKKPERPQRATAGQPEQGRSEKPERKSKKRKAKTKARGGRKSTAVCLGLYRTYAHVAPVVF